MMMTFNCSVNLIYLNPESQPSHRVPHRSFNIDKIFSPLGSAFTTPRRNLGFLGPPHTSGSN